MYRIAIVGVGRGGAGVGGHSMGYVHAQTYRASGSCTIVGAADLSQENLARFAQTFDVSYITSDYHAMLAELQPDIVSVATYVGSHREIVEACVHAGVKGIWCEKPLCLTMQDGEAMVTACHANGVKLIVHHYRRYLHLFQEARRLLRSGLIGAPVEYIGRGDDWDLMEYGTHWLDMLRFFADDQPVQWVMGQAHSNGRRQGYNDVRYGHVLDDYGIAYICFADGTRGLIEAGAEGWHGFLFRLLGTEGFIDLFSDGRLQVVNGHGCHVIPTHSDMHAPLPGYEGEHPYTVVLQGLLNWIEGGTEPEISGRNALRSSELYLAAYESAKRRDRVTLPLVGQSVFPLADLS